MKVFCVRQFAFNPPKDHRCYLAVNKTKLKENDELQVYGKEKVSAPYGKEEIKAAKQKLREKYGDKDMTIIDEAVAASM